MIESEKKFKKALDDLGARVAQLQQDDAQTISALEAQNKVLQDGLSDLKKDYEDMERLFVTLKDEVAKARASADQSQSEASPDTKVEERDTLKEELDMTRRDYQDLEDSFRALKGQVTALEEEGQDFASNTMDIEAGVVSVKEVENLKADNESLKAELTKIKEDYVMQLAENELLVAEANGVNSVRDALKDGLDKTITRLEGMQQN